MVMVPRYNDTRVDEAKTPSVTIDPRRPANAFGNRDIPNAAQGLADVAIKNVAQEEQDRRVRKEELRQHNATQNAEIAKFEEEQRQTANQLRVRDSSLELGKDRVRIQIEMQKKTGASAAEAPSFVAKEWKKSTEAIRKNLANDDQRFAFDDVVAKQSFGLDKDMQGHVSKQLTQYDEDQTNLALKMNRDNASLHYTDAKLVNESRKNIEDSIKDWGKRNNIKSGDKILLDKKAEEISALHRDILSRMLIDNQDTLAKEYDKEHSGEILTEDADVLNRVRTESSMSRTRLKQEYESNLYNRAMENKVGIDELRSERRAGNIDIPFYEKMVKIVTSPFEKEVDNNGKQITEADRSRALLEIFQEYDKLNGADVDFSSSKIESDSSGNRAEAIEKFREFAEERFPYIKREQGASFFNATELDYNQALAGKVGFMRSLFNFLSTSMYSSKSFAPAVNDAMTESLKILSPDVSQEQAQKDIAKITKKFRLASDPISSRYHEGEIVTNPSGIKAIVHIDEKGKVTFDRIK